MDSDAGLKVFAQLKASQLTTLAAETLENIASYLYRPSQLNNLSRTCKQLHSALQPWLYREFSISFPRSWSSAMFLETLLECGAEGLQYTKRITVTMQHDALDALSYASVGQELDPDENWDETKDEMGQKPSQPKVLNISSFPKVHTMIATDMANTLLSYGLRLETLGLGSITWTDIWQGGSSPIENYLCPRIFHIDYPVNLHGKRQPLVTQIAKGTATGANEYSSNLRVFEPYWLG